MARILIADDNPDLLEITTATLEDRGHEVISVVNGAEVIEQLELQPIDLLVTDVLMPDKEGIETILEIRRTNPILPIIAISGGGHVGPVDYLTMARAAGANAALTKPVAPSKLASAIEELLGNPPAPA
ncbi:response regulator [Synoicihabitans lomoniglobus]|uniref:Response regulator n=1 Tax=Synoicihabitans lomoniglobus TaxID=2909285 RepID=A0AAF0CS59_9BACT|nr:response regulator [Opitutaceae bacterium LMO-M01]WED67104.1 response regulator [Opitutaceae bacterium LMO-M01]